MMGLQIIKDAICDRCGRKCSHISEKTYKQIDDEVANCKFKYIESFHYHYTEVELNFHDDRFPADASAKTILCGECTESLNNWLRNQEDGRR